jgi:putative SOS response-associated peptidase YedK
MCGRFTLRQPVKDIVAAFSIKRPPEWQLAIRYNVAPSQTIPVVRSESGERELVQMSWGLIPSWAKDAKIAQVNARSETAAEKPMFRSAMKKRRCLIPVDGFYEWKRTGKTKQPFLFHRPDDKPFAFAGLWEHWGDADNCAILTTSANGLMAPIHDRMPVILSPNDYDAWLDSSKAPADVAYLLEPVPDDELVAVAVNPVVNNARNEGPECVEPFDAE